jgi:hypothetical protein
MATIAERTVPGVGKRMLLVGVAGLLLGGVAGGLVDRALQSEETSPPRVESSAPAVPGGQAHVTDKDTTAEEEFRQGERDLQNRDAAADAEELFRQGERDFQEQPTTADAVQEFRRGERASQD